LTIDLDFIVAEGYERNADITYSVPIKCVF
jgi:hypothetical protein